MGSLYGVGMILVLRCGSFNVSPYSTEISSGRLHGCCISGSCVVLQHLNVCTLFQPRFWERREHSHRDPTRKGVAAKENRHRAIFSGYADKEQFHKRPRPAPNEIRRLDGSERRSFRISRLYPALVGRLIVFGGGKCTMLQYTVVTCIWRSEQTGEIL
jgi:hypothetical protein